MEELARLQGFPSDLVSWAQLGLSERQFGFMLGNAMTLPILLMLIPKVLHAAGKINDEQAAILVRRAVQFNLFQKNRV